MPVLATDVAIAIGLALAISCKSIVRLSIAPKAMHAGAGFSYSLYLIHLPLAVAVGAFLREIGLAVRSVPAGRRNVLGIRNNHLRDYGLRLDVLTCHGSQH